MTSVAGGQSTGSIEVGGSRTTNIKAATLKPRLRRTAPVSTRELVDSWARNTLIDSPLSLLHRALPIMAHGARLCSAIKKLQAANPFYFQAHPIDPLALVGADQILLHDNLNATWTLLNSFEISRKMIQEENFDFLQEQGRVMKDLAEAFRQAITLGRQRLDSVNFLSFYSLF
jgi:hypothetical protein